MINRNEYTANGKCCVTYTYNGQGVIVQCLQSYQQRIFGGYSWLLERYRELAENFSEELSYEDACNYFTLTKEEEEMMRK